MNKVISRLLVFFVGVPLVLGFVWLPYFNHLAFHLLVCAASIIASCELHDILSHNISLPPKPFVAVMSALVPVAALLQALFAEGSDFLVSGLDYFTGGLDFLTAVLIFVFIIILVYEVFSAKTFEHSNHRMTGTCFIVLYSGYLVTFLSRLTVARVNGQDASTPFLILFLLMVFLCDSLAWLFGVLLGKNNRGFVKASPNKSIAGFIGGFVGSVAAAVLAYFVWPSLFKNSLIALIVTAVFSAFAAILGDLVESIFKRSAGVKDSGTIVPGRGGLLDSIDSILLAAPLFYLLVSIFFGPFDA